MRTITKTLKTVAEYVEEFDSTRGLGYLFQSRALRDQVAKSLRAKGVAVQVRATRGQRLHPEYVDDYEGTVEVGFGNTDYQTYWKVLYAVKPA